MTSRQKFFALAAKSGIEIDYSHSQLGCYRLDLIAPEGKVFLSSGSMFDSSLNGWDDDPKHAPWEKLLPELEAIISQGFGLNDEEAT